ncbi:SH3 domain-containing protein [Kordia sp.]|uniref:SH3 domain-containing protein n=1 Tax=Kordia sp. TaxID=1965332 RepID=UPI003B58EC30
MKIYSYISKFYVLFAIVLLTACAGETKKNVEQPSNEVTSETPETIEAAEETNEFDTYYIWVDNINVRAIASTKGEIIGTYKGTDLTFTGKKSNSTEEIVLRSVVYNSHWLEVTTKDDKKGWIFGGAVKNEGDDVANDIITNEQFSFPHFGTFNVKSWSDLGITRKEAGDAETSVYSYLKDGKIIEIEKTEFGEYGYDHIYRLMDDKRNLLKERIFTFDVDVGNDDKRIMEIMEMVKDYTTNKKYTRSQKVRKHFMQMNAKPLMVNGTWEVVNFDKNSEQ